METKNASASEQLMLDTVVSRTESRPTAPRSRTTRPLHRLATRLNLVAPLSIGGVRPQFLPSHNKPSPWPAFHHLPTLFHLGNHSGKSAPVPRGLMWDLTGGIIRVLTPGIFAGIQSQSWAGGDTQLEDGQ